MNRKEREKKPIKEHRTIKKSLTPQKKVSHDEYPKEALKTIIISRSLQEEFECVVDKHVFIDKPWKKISIEKINKNIKSQNQKSCFWEFRKELQNIKKEHVLVGYKSSNYTDEEFVICLTDKANKYIETEQIKLESGLKERVEKSIYKIPNAWKSESTENEIKEMRPVRTRGKLTYKWKVPTDRLQTKVKFEDSNSKSMRNQYVKLEPRSNEIFEISNRLLRDSGIQTTIWVNREIQTVLKISHNKSIQAIAVEEEMFQPQFLTESNSKIEDFFERHVPNLEKQLLQNQLYDLYRDDYKLLKNKNEKSYIKCIKDVTLLPGAYHNVALPKKYVSCYTWHPTIPGIFALTYMTSNNGLYKSINLEQPTEKTVKLSANKREKLKSIDEQNNIVVIWSISDMIFPKLKLESFEEVCCVEFNPVDGNTVVGGLINGQICIWDIKGKLDSMLNQAESYQELSTKHSSVTDLKSETVIKLTALSAIFESHMSMVTALQWIHPLNEITPFGQLVTTKEGKFSLQFFSSSLDGTVKLWDLNSTLPLDENQDLKIKCRFKHPENLNKYKSPLSVYNNRLKPSYTITMMDPENVITPLSPIIPITALSFNMPLLKYDTLNEPKSVPMSQNKLNRLLIIGTIMGQVGFVTWNGYDADHKGENNEKCKPNWWGQVHDGPITCIKRNIFYPDINLVCGGRAASILSLNYEKLPLWYKEFDNLTNSVLWSAVHPAEFRVSFNTGGELQFWDFKKYTHRPYQTFNYTLGGGLLATMSSPCLPVYFIDAQQRGMSSTEYENKELICFGDSAGEIRMITVEESTTKIDEEEKMDQMLQNEVHRLKELDQYNEKCKETYNSDNESTDHSSSPLSIPDAQPEIVSLSYKQYKFEQGKEYYRQYLERNPWSRLVKIRDEEKLKK